MKNSRLCCFFLLFLSFMVTPVAAQKLPKKKLTKMSFRGWEYLVSRLEKDGVSRQELIHVYQNKRMPRFQRVTFALEPKESKRQYSLFFKEKMIKQAEAFIEKYSEEFAKAKGRFNVDPEVLAAILLIETQYGRVTGNSLIVNRLSRIANISEPGNLAYNVKKLKAKHPDATEEQILARARYLDAMFYPELPALFEIARRNKLEIFNIKGSYAGAFGVPQFLPSTYLKFAIDGNNDGVISLFQFSDAINSTANFLSSYGWQNIAPLEAKKQVIWRYNHSDAYVESILEIADTLRLRRIKKVSPLTPDS